MPGSLWKSEAPDVGFNEPQRSGGMREEMVILRPRGKEELGAWVTCVVEDGDCGSENHRSHDLKELQALPNWKCPPKEGVQ